MEISFKPTVDSKPKRFWLSVQRVLLLMMICVFALTFFEILPWRRGVAWIGILSFYPFGSGCLDLFKMRRSSSQPSKPWNGIEFLWTINAFIASLLFLALGWHQGLESEYALFAGSLMLGGAYLVIFKSDFTYRQDPTLTLDKGFHAFNTFVIKFVGTGLAIIGTVLIAILATKMS